MKKQIKISIMIYKYIIKFKCSLLLFLLVILVGCEQKDSFEKVISFERNLENTTKPELVCQLSEENNLLRDIVNFTILNDTSFVVLDGKGAYLYHISGTFIKQFGKTGQAGGEMITPMVVYATSDLVYIWCASLMKFLIFDHEANLKNELKGFKIPVSKFVVNSSNEILYIYTSGYLNSIKNKVVDVIDIYNIAEETSKKLGERGPEDEVLSSWSNSGGLYVDSDRFIYLNPGNLIINELNLNFDKIVQYKINDKAFNSTKIISNIYVLMENTPKLLDYLYNNSYVKDIYKNDNHFFIISEIGKDDINVHTGVVVEMNRKVKLYILDSSFNPIRTILYDYLPSMNVVYSNSLYYISRINDDLILNRFPLF